MRENNGWKWLLFQDLQNKSSYNRFSVDVLFGFTFNPDKMRSWNCFALVHRDTTSGTV